VVAKTSAVLAVSGGLVASLGLQASAAAPSTDQSATTTASTGSTQAASGIPVAFQGGVSASPSYGELGFTAIKAPKPKPKPQPTVTMVVSSSPAGSTPVVADRTQQTSRSSVRADISVAPSAVAPVSIKAGAPGSAEFGAAVISIAQRYFGTYYRWGGTTPAGFDCSGFTQYVYRQVGINLPRIDSDQAASGTRVSSSQAMPGDLVHMPGHIGIYAGNGMMIDSPRTGTTIGLHQIWSSSATFIRL
jgi:cell wall-associated NlpC family hydrolase